MLRLHGETASERIILKKETFQPVKGAGTRDRFKYKARVITSESGNR